ncbi:glycosyltransferase family protein [Planktothrix paucivesiculata]|uniref:Glycosyltransferase n=1 Tax=Planktothrix paucivesiculata PCC 9631 TaxID=671071 RepID=A0A7Z9BEK1_9CYAN|nr:glycosyltransferase [Planktothrix paucivesiculata]VXD10316.1 putative glycosyltransferase [Planktothrix paucivesiculata PCC 9631]
MNRDSTDQVSDDHFNQKPSELLNFLPPNAQVLIDVGCLNRSTSYYYKRINPQSFYWGILIDSELSSEITQDLDQITLSSIDQLETIRLELEEKTVDCLIYERILPQTRNPLKVLQYHIRWLKDQGQVLAYIPNSQYWQNIINLLQGKSENEVAENTDYQGFTLEKIQKLFWEAGLYIYEIQTRGKKDDQFQNFLELVEPLRNTLGLDPNRFATQTAAEFYIVRAIKSLQPPRRLLIQTAIMAPTGCDRLRVLEPDQLSATIPGTRTLSASKSIPNGSILPEEEKVFIWQRTILSYDHHLEILRNLLKQDYLIIAEIDDNPLRRREYADNRYLSYRGCHGVQTSTDPLKKFLQQFNPHVAIFKNHLLILPPPRIYANPKVTLFFGALNREQDWQPIMETLNRVLIRHQSLVKVKVIHDRRFFENLAISDKEFEPFCSYDRYHQILQTCDIGLLPLTPTPVNLMKSDLKFLECAGHGVAVLASPTVYEQSVIHEETGLIYRNIQQFEMYLNELIINNTLRQKIANNAYLWVKSNRLLCQHYQQRREWYLKMRDNLPSLNQELRQRVPEL